ncbi:Cytochrome P450 [Macrophomina phaseolina MS6]|uniref:Cytochrome P450 n=1 Tax=Macrophomina phaseolina (strain MS6) TaxID=1126212 RepID=K2RV01_MACPH|nr:Cytochrome P450 [Macrophomina phaseolina MS6]
MDITREDIRKIFSLKLFLTITLTYTITTIIYRLFFHPLRKVPGPFLAKFTELWRTGKYFAGDWHDEILKLHRQYGPIVRLSPNEVSFVDKDALVQIYGHGKSNQKTDWYVTWDMPNVSRNAFMAIDIREHSMLRKRVAGAYSMSSILTMEKLLHERVDTLCARFAEIAREGTVIDLYDWASFLAFDVVGTVAFGKPFGFLDKGKDDIGLIKAIYNAFWWTSNCGYLPMGGKIVLHPATQKIADFFNSTLSGATSMTAFAKEQVLKRMESVPREGGAKRDMLDHFLSMKQPNGEPCGLFEIIGEASAIVAAGADTTAIGMRSVLGHVLLHPKSYRRIQREIDEAYSAHLAENEPQQEIPYTVLEKLPYLQACVKEGLRLHPSILWQLPRRTPPEGITIRGHYIPPSATVSMSPKAHNRCREIFGDDADEWRPERWIPGEGSSEESVREMNKFDTSFGYGSRVCIGKNLALVEIHKFIFEVLHRFDVELLNKERPWIVKSLWFSCQTEMFVKLKARS